jgi:hypothetical protein
VFFVVLFWGGGGGGAPPRHYSGGDAGAVRQIEREEGEGEQRKEGGGPRGKIIFLHVF